MTFNPGILKFSTIAFVPITATGLINDPPSPGYWTGTYSAAELGNTPEDPTTTVDIVDLVKGSTGVSRHIVVVNISGSNSGSSIEITGSVDQHIWTDDGSTHLWKTMANITTNHFVLTNVFNATRSDYFWPVSASLSSSTTEDIYYFNHQPATYFTQQNVWSATTNNNSFDNVLNLISCRTYLSGNIP